MNENKSKIGVATVYTGYNYGSALQAYATTIILSNLNKTAQMLKLKGSFIAGRDIRLKKLLIIGARSLCHFGGIKSLKNYKQNVSKSMNKQSMALCDSFIKEKLCPAEMSYSELKKRAESQEYSAFLCGSDQIWNASVFYVDPFYYLQFAPKEKRIAFAPSFGREFVPNYNKKKIKKYLSEIPRKSVRESSGAKIIKELTGDSAEVLLDPTLVLNAEQWRKSLDIKEKKDKYLLAYFLDTPSPLAKQTVEKISREQGLKIISLPYRTDNPLWQEAVAGPKEFVELVNGANFVCTDSFHGTAFSLNLGVPFYTFERDYGNAENQSTRIKSLLETVGLEENLITKMPKCIKAKQDFTEALSILNLKRESAYNYLKDKI